ncbi:MAG: hypothetical protein KC493_04455 [Bacteriovoracaceae bacterium]|nr:hypothetical protein [Bacteriovoracaceae bacterium]
MEDKYYWLLISVLILLTVILTALLLIVVYFVFFKEKDNPPALENNESEEVPTVKHIRPPAFDAPTLTTCEEHEDTRAVNVCAICSTQLCELCVREDENIVFCPSHFKTYVDHNWVEISNVKTTPSTPEASAHVFEFKKHLWKSDGTPTYIVTHYKIDVESDQIESYVKLMVREEEKEELEKGLKETMQ